MSINSESKRFDVPSFLTKDYPPREFDSTEGVVTTVRALSDLPPWVLERIPELKKNEGSEDDEYVIKQYNKEGDPDFFTPGNFSVMDRMLFDPSNYPKSLNPKEKGKVSVVDKANILKARQEHLRRYFGESGRKFLLDSFFVPSANKDSNVSVYEIQKKLPSHILLIDFRDFESLSLSDEQKHKLVHNAIALKKY